VTLEFDGRIRGEKTLSDPTVEVELVIGLARLAPEKAVGVEDG
jgi:hypothetical protein